jgi:2-keto-4-pentenoate hydratase/2-oxohepta-3-ene-1,7-dioic acid hydratase in catechol pathway
MRLATFAVDTPVGRQRRVGVVEGRSEDLADHRYLDVTTAYAALLAERGEADPVAVAETLAPSDMRTFLERGGRAMDAAREVREAAAADALPERGPGDAQVRFDASEVRLLAPLPRPNTFRDAMVFEEHASGGGERELADVWYEQPIYYKGNPDTIVGPGETVEWPDYSDVMDYELELAAVVGKRGTDVPAEEADRYIAGFTVLNDFSARDAQREEMEGRLGPAKGKDFASGMGPYLTTADAFDAVDARMTAEIEGEQLSEGRPGDMYHSFADILAHVSQSEPLVPGDVVGSGTVGGGCGIEHGRFLEDGDTVSLSVEGIGTLTNTVVGR